MLSALKGEASWWRFSSMFSIMPSRRWTILSVTLATPLSWVTTTIVMPSLFSWRSSCITSTDVRLSNAPVGSSASIICGRVMIARAMATRCFCPPESSFGMWWAWSFSPRRSRYSMASMLRRLRLTPWYMSGSATFSSAFLNGMRLNDWNTKPIRRLR